MKNLTFTLLIISFLGCASPKEEAIVEKFIVETKVQLKPGKTKMVLDLFQSTNPTLVKEQSDWLSASFSSIDNENIVIVRALWKSKESYLAFARTDQFQNTMRKFSEHFAGPPETSISKVLFEM